MTTLWPGVPASRFHLDRALQRATPQCPMKASSHQSCRVWEGIWRFKFFLCFPPPPILNPSSLSLPEAPGAFQSSDRQLQVAFSLSPLRAWVSFSPQSSFTFILLFRFPNSFLSWLFLKTDQSSTRNLLWLCVPICHMKESCSPLQHLDANPATSLCHTHHHTLTFCRENLWELTAGAGNVPEMLVLDLGWQSRRKCIGFLVIHRNFTEKKSVSYFFHYCSFFQES